MLEEFLEMGGGYVLNFSDRTFADFFRDFRIDIDSMPYMEGHSGSKANRMRSFWDREPDPMVGDVIEEMMEYAESYRGGHPLAAEVRKIVRRLKGGRRVEADPPRPQPATAPATPRPVATHEGPVEIFFSYAHEDEELMDAVRLQLVARERMGQIVKWHDRMIPAGDGWREEIDERIERAHVILLFMSPDFLASRYCYEVEGEVALRRHREGSARVIPVVLRACDWTVTPFGEFQGLPRDGTPISQWRDIDQATLAVARGIMEAIS